MNLNLRFISTITAASFSISTLKPELYILSDLFNAVISFICFISRMHFSSPLLDPAGNDTVNEPCWQWVTVSSPEWCSRPPHTYRAENTSLALTDRCNSEHSCLRQVFNDPAASFQLSLHFTLSFHFLPWESRMDIVFRRILAGEVINGVKVLWSDLIFKLSLTSNLTDLIYFGHTFYNAHRYNDLWIQSLHSLSIIIHS